MNEDTKTEILDGAEIPVVPILEAGETSLPSPTMDEIAEATADAVIASTTEFSEEEIKPIRIEPPKLTEYDIRKLEDAKAKRARRHARNLRIAAIPGSGLKVVGV